MDALARELGIDPVELRRRNFITEFPATLASGLTIDSGDYHASLDRRSSSSTSRRSAPSRPSAASAVTRSSSGSASRPTSRCAASRRRGILGAIRYVAGGWDAATIRCLPSGTVQVLTGTSPHGQGHETAWSQIAADELGYAVDEIEVLHGDTTVSPLGMDTYGSRSLTVGGVALQHAAQKIVAKARTLAAHELEVDEDELDYEGGTFSAAGTTAVTMKELAFAAWSAHNLPARHGARPRGDRGLRPAELQLAWRGACGRRRDRHRDRRRATGPLRRRRRRRQRDQPDDRRRPDRTAASRRGSRRRSSRRRSTTRTANLLTSSLTNYLVPSAAELPKFELDRTETPSPTNPLGVKGVGETGTIASPAAVMNAVVDALAPFGVTDIDMPATPERVWRAIQEARHDSRRRSTTRSPSPPSTRSPLLGSREDAKLLAGGHSLIPLLRLRFTRPSLLVDIGRVSPTCRTCATRASGSRSGR